MCPLYEQTGAPSRARQTLNEPSFEVQATSRESREKSHCIESLKPPPGVRVHKSVPFGSQSLTAVSQLTEATRVASHDQDTQMTADT